jgi:hypothetical protein
VSAIGAPFIHFNLFVWAMAVLFGANDELIAGRRVNRHWEVVV